ncbi:hypothetical protein [Streptomyces sp. NPDC058964]|uniref:hypothetical protein n=1 Tax=Streptomyces sp. NPDC058964 TaxID=3346681 RepID=UPI003676E213
MASRLSGVVMERARPLLEPGEQIRRVVLAQGGIRPTAQVWIVLPGLLAGRILADAAGAVIWQEALWSALGAMVAAVIATCLITRRVLLVTDRSVVLLEYGRFGGVRPARVIARLPQGTRIGPLSGTWARIELAGERLWVHKRWHGDAAAFETRLG